MAAGTDFKNRLRDALPYTVTIGGRPATADDCCTHGRLVCDTCALAILAPEWGAPTTEA